MSGRNSSGAEAATRCYNAEELLYDFLIIIIRNTSRGLLTVVILMFTLRLYFTFVFRLGWCSQPMAKQSALPLTVWYLRVELVVLAMTGWRSMRAPPSSATADLIGVNITVEMKTTLSVLAPPSLDPSRAPPSQSSSTLVSGSLQVGSWRLSAAQHMLPQI